MNDGNDLYWASWKLGSGTSQSDFQLRDIYNGNSAGDFVKAWRHVHNIFEAVGANNLTWIKEALITQIPTNFPKIKAVVYMNWDTNAGKTYPIQSSQAASDAWAAGIGAAK